MSGSTGSSNASALPKSDSATINLALNLTWHRDDTWTFINDLRTRHYPRDLLFNEAHIGLFAHLKVPANDLAGIIRDLEEIVSTFRRFEFVFEAVAKKPWKKNVAIPVRSSQLKRLRAELNDR